MTPTDNPFQRGALVLEDGSRFEGTLFGACVPAAGETVFTTGMVGYPESLTDPSYYGQILAFTAPLIGNYGVPDQRHWESARVQVRGVIVSELSREFSHWNAAESLDDWLRRSGVPGLTGVDTRTLTRRLRESGTMLGRIETASAVPFDDPNSRPLLPEVSISAPAVIGDGDRTVLLLDCGCKESIAANLVRRGARVRRVPWNHDLRSEDYDGLVISSGPGDPKMCPQAIHQIRHALRRGKPLLGICLGHQLLALAIGADTYKLKYGHRGQNQPVQDKVTGRCHITSQNHGFAVDARGLPADWREWFVNLNDGTNEGIRHDSLPFFSIQFHPEAAPGPVDTQFVFDQFMECVRT